MRKKKIREMEKEIDKAKKKESKEYFQIKFLKYVF